MLGKCRKLTDEKSCAPSGLSLSVTVCAFFSNLASYRESHPRGEKWCSIEMQMSSSLEERSCVLVPPELAVQAGKDLGHRSTLLPAAACAVLSRGLCSDDHRLLDFTAEKNCGMSHGVAELRFLRNSFSLVMAAHTFNPSAQEAKANGSLCPCPKTKKEKKYRKKKVLT